MALSMRHPAASSHLQEIYNGMKAALKEGIGSDSDGTYDLERIRLSRPSHISEVNWDAQIAFWNDPKNRARATQNKQKPAKNQSRYADKESRSIAAFEICHGGDMMLRANRSRLLTENGYLCALNLRMRYWPSLRGMQRGGNSGVGRVIARDRARSFHLASLPRSPMLTYKFSQMLTNLESQPELGRWQAGLAGTWEMSADVARGHGGDGGGDDRPSSHHIPTSCGGCLGNRGKGTRKPNLGGTRAGRQHTRQETRNLGLKAITDKSGPVSIRFEFGDRETLMPLGEHAAHWANYLGELVRELPLHYPSWRQVPAEQKAGVMAQIGGKALDSMNRTETTPEASELSRPSHISESKENDKMNHPCDGRAWKYFDIMKPEFSGDPRNVRLRSPAKDIDVYLQPLIKELQELWKGLWTKDAATGTHFQMKAGVLWTINDFPARSSLSGWSGQGYYACPTCNEDTPLLAVKNKIVYVGYRIFLRTQHPLRSKFKEFYGFPEHNPKPRNFTEMDIQLQISKVFKCFPGKHPHIAKKNPKPNRQIELNWKRQIQRHAKGKARLGNLESSKGVVKIENVFCKFIKGVRLPDGFGSNFKQKVTADDNNITGMKSHDSHIMMHRLLPYGVQRYLPKNIAAPIIELCLFFKQLCARTLMQQDMAKAKKQSISIMIELEKIFPPAFFDIMIHVAIHLPDEAILGGPLRYRWMFPFERYMKKLKNYVQNKAKPEGSIAEGYVAEEALTFCSRYLKDDVETRFNRLGRNDDGLPEPDKFEVFRSVCKPMGRMKESRLTTDVMQAVVWFVLNNSPEVDADILAYREESPDNVETSFPAWFNYKIREKNVKFVVHERDILHITQCSGVSTPGLDGDMYYGQLEEILELTYTGHRKVIHHILTDREFQKNNQYILATQATQVFYHQDLARQPRSWKVVEHVYHRDVAESDQDVIHGSSSSHVTLSVGLTCLEHTDLSINAQSTEVDAPPVNDDNAKANEDNVDFINNEDDFVAHVLDDDDVVVFDDDEVNPSTNVEEMACVAPRSHSGDAGGSPPRRPNRPVPAQCQSSMLRLKMGNASLKKAFRENNKQPLQLGFDYADLGTFHPLRNFASMLNSLMGETVWPLPLACEWEEIPEAFKAHIYPTLEKVEKGHYEDLIETWRKGHSSKKTGEFKTEQNKQRYLDMKAMQDRIKAGIIPFKTDQEILDEVVPSDNRQNMSGMGRKLPGGGSTSRRHTHRAYGDVMNRDQMTQILRQQEQEKKFVKEASGGDEERSNGLIWLACDQLAQDLAREKNNECSSGEEEEEGEQQSGDDYSSEEEE
ncbi:hypothetical protein Tco_1070604 [Tanacetum coccineum]|uniref:DUF4218 domain-containing protein n=1 Tax=Tanacetum coccineum TaxID=301880 RepID=A0ABQ5HNP4_9ASTR